MTRLPPLVEALLKGTSYPETPREVKLLQTQMSFVFLTGDRAYKIKKPIDLGFADFTTIEKRRFYCHQEVGLNRRLCPDIYLGVVDVTEDESGFRVSGTGRTVEHAVMMIQLPSDRTLDRLLDSGRVSPEMIEAVARKLERFHRDSRADGEIAGYGDRSVISQNTEENFSQTAKYVGLSLDRQTYETICSYTRRFLDDHAALFKKRMREGRIKDCHGDLHSEHVCFADDICIFDCIEFNDRFRYCDVASEIAFLAMDLDFHGHPELSGHFVDSYVRLADDHDLGRLLDFYKCYRAYVRGKANSLELDDASVPESEKALARDIAGRYFKLAREYAEAPGPA